MGIINPQVPILGQPNSTEQVKVRDALNTIIGVINGDIDQVNLGSALQNIIQQSTFQPGDLKMVAHDNEPTGWLKCNGQEVSRAVYADLWDVLQHAEYGDGDEATTFLVPDLQGRAPVGLDNGAGRLTIASVLGAAGGEEEHELTTAELAEHNHGSGTLDTNSTGSHQHSSGGLGTSNASLTLDRDQQGTAAGSAIRTTGWGSSGTHPLSQNHNHSVTGSTASAGSHKHNVTGSTGNRGSGDGHNNVQPIQVVNFLVKT